MACRPRNGMSVKKVGNAMKNTAESSATSGDATLRTARWTSTGVRAKSSGRTALKT